MYGARETVGHWGIHLVGKGTGLSSGIISRAPCKWMGPESGRMRVHSMKGWGKVSGRLSGVPCRQERVGPTGGCGMSECPWVAGAVSQGPPALQGHRPLAAAARRGPAWCGSPG